MTKQTCAVKTLAQIQAKNEHKSKDKDGKIVTSQKFIKNFTFFEDIEYLYSKKCPEGIKIDGWHVALYCRFLSYQANGNNCYESHDTLARKCKASTSTVKRRIKDLIKLGLVTTDKRPNSNISSLLYTALPLTDAHIIPPDQLSAAPESDVVRQQPEPMPAPEPVKAAEEKANVAPDWDAWDAPEYPEQPAPTMTNVIEEAVIVSQSIPESVATTTESDQAVMDVDVALEVVCERLSHPDSLRQSQRDDTFTAYARRVLRNDGKRLPRRIEERLEERFEQLHPHLYSRFEIPF